VNVNGVGSVTVGLILLRLEYEVSAVSTHVKFSKLKLFSFSIARSQNILVFGLL
jgi:hypothetical protein